MAIDRSSSAGVRLVRHEGIDRIYHWIMAVAVLALLATGLLPKLGVGFPWVTIHWVAGVVLAVLVVYHIVRGLAWSRLRLMLPGWRDAVDGVREFASLFSRIAAPKTGKYAPAQKVYHWGVAVVILALVVTGCFMLAKLDTPFWQRNPYFLDSSTWGIVYVIHGYAAMILVTLLIMHIYFAVRPEKWWMTRSMLRGWITRQEHLAHFDGARWPAEEVAASAPSEKTTQQHSTA